MAVAQIYSMYYRLLSSERSANGIHPGVSQHALGYPKGLPPGAPPSLQLYFLRPRDVVYQKVVKSRMWNLHKDFGLTVTQVEYAVQLMHPLALGCIKASFMMFYRRIFCAGQRTWFSIFTSFMLIIITLWSLTFCLAFIFRCGTHFWANWNTIMSLIVYCPAAFGVQEAFAISDFIMDIMVILAPVPAV